jgi:hypothetical protein
MDVGMVVDRLRGLDSSATISRGNDKGEYVNLYFATDDLKSLWESVRHTLSAAPGLANATIVACEGENGWDDYLLLHHFDPSEALDGLL